MRENLAGILKALTTCFCFSCLGIWGGVDCCECERECEMGREARGFSYVYVVYFAWVSPDLIGLGTI
jgi:hypothetical protein